jgi:hypothetical protein
MDEEKTPTTSDTEDVEAHGATDRPVDDKERTAASDEPDVEGHGLTDRPVDRPVD